MPSQATQNKNQTSSSSKKHKESPTKQLAIIGFLSIMVYGYFNSFYNFRVGAKKENLKVREISDMWYIVIASLINLVISIFFTC